jgi:hypothetical protein
VASLASYATELWNHVARPPSPNEKGDHATSPAETEPLDIRFGDGHAVQYETNNSRYQEQFVGSHDAIYPTCQAKTKHPAVDTVWHITAQDLVAEDFFFRERELVVIDHDAG